MAYNDLEKDINNPIIALIDMDCFYVQVELKFNPEYLNKPTAVVQYNSWRGGGIIAVSYEARNCGIDRRMRGDEAKAKCPELHLFSVPESRGKADLTKYRNAGADVIKCLGNHAKLIEKASVDEAYIDLTNEVDNLLLTKSENIPILCDNSELDRQDMHSLGYANYKEWIHHLQTISKTSKQTIFDDDIRLGVGSYLVDQMRRDIYQKLGYKCSAGISISKTVAKYACGLHKPNQQTIVTQPHIQTLFAQAPISKIRNLGGKIGDFVQQTLEIKTMGDLYRYSYQDLIQKFGDKTGSWLYNLARGRDDEGVVSRRLTQSVGCSKRFPGVGQLNTVEKVRHWLTEMANEICERLQRDKIDNGRIATHLSLSYRHKSGHKILSGSRVVPLTSSDVLLRSEDIVAACSLVLDSLNLANQNGLSNGTWHPPLLEIGLSAGKFREQTGKNDISRYMIDVPMNTLQDSSTISTASVQQTPLQQSTKETTNEVPKSFFARLFDKEASPNRNICTDESSRESIDNPESIECANVEEDEEDYFECEKCKRKILAWILPEHLDWHVASDLQKELSREVVSEQKVESTNNNNNNNKRKANDEIVSRPSKPTKSKKKEINSHKQTSITKFFK